jgi:hypothetical protein
MLHQRRAWAVSILVWGAACAGSPAPSRPAEPAPNAGAGAPDGEGRGAAPQGAGKRAPCTFGADQSCNEDPSVSSLWGRCTEYGVCECHPGFELSPESALCRPARAP